MKPPRTNADAADQTDRASETEAVVKAAIRQAGAGGGFILADNHGEIPWQVPEAVLMATMDTVRSWGNYPLEELAVHE